MPDLEWIRKLCASFPDTAETMPWADDLCFKVRGKIFTGMALSDGHFPRITLKVTPEKFHELLEIEGISIAPYVGRYNWITLANPNVIPAAELEGLIRESYELVASKAPNRKSAAKKSVARNSGAKKLPAGKSKAKRAEKPKKSKSRPKIKAGKSRTRTQR
jgi:predicted DNA-binding protein (MmcQ/YjbR family)